MKGLRALMLPSLLLAAFHASASDSGQERVAAAKRYLEVAQMAKKEMFRALQSLPRQ